MTINKNHFRVLMFSFIISILGLTEISDLSAQETFPCVWRNPERTMKKIFPNAVDYKTVNKPILPEQRKEIEYELGKELLPGQQNIFTYYEMTDKTGNIIGYIYAPAQKGEYGVIEFVFGLNKEKNLTELYIQRSRERENKFKDSSFLKKFNGHNAKEYKQIAKLNNAHITYGERAVIDGITKELLLVNKLQIKEK